ncbi:MAG: NADH-quinone oxidoreductase subunit NuoK [Dehalococcoidia bacterium]|nr:NADH-quinone oxidoreductase subunit NuoK [Dehalococcoidia bacterium]HRC61705.1 NADH-quinone oxidoreductase subunit NuoK [Dehalococcoidia bacterium]
MSVTLAHYLAVSGVVFGIGIAVALSKRNAIAVLMGVELMLNAVNLTFLAFSRFSAAFSENSAPIAGHVFVVFVLTVAAAEAAVALAMAVLVYRRRETVDLDRINLMRW